MRQRKFAAHQRSRHSCNFLPNVGGALTSGRPVLRLVDSGLKAHARLAASMGRALLAAIDELARTCAILDDYSTGASAALVPLTAVAISTRSASTMPRPMTHELRAA